MDVQNMDQIFDENDNKENIQVLSANLEDNKKEGSGLASKITSALEEKKQSDDIEDIASVLFYLNLASVSWHKQTPKKEPANQVAESEKPNTSAPSKETPGDDEVDKLLIDLYNDSDSSEAEEAQEKISGEVELNNEVSKNTDQNFEKPVYYDSEFSLINLDEDISNNMLIENNGVDYHSLL